MFVSSRDQTVIYHHSRALFELPDTVTEDFVHRRRELKIPSFVDCVEFTWYLRPPRSIWEKYDTAKEGGMIDTATVVVYTPQHGSAAL